MKVIFLDKLPFLRTHKFLFYIIAKMYPNCKREVKRKGYAKMFFTHSRTIYAYRQRTNRFERVFLLIFISFFLTEATGA